MSTSPSAVTTKAWTPWTSWAESSSFFLFALAASRKGGGPFLPCRVGGTAPVCRKVPVGAITDRPWILPEQNPSPQGENKAIPLRKIRKTAFFGGRSMIAPTSSKENMVSQQSSAGSVTPPYRTMEKIGAKNRDPVFRVPMGDMLTSLRSGASGASPCRRRNARR